METNLTYYTPNLPASFSGIKKLKQHNNTPNIEKWLKKQRTYTLHKPARKRLKNYRKYFASHYLYQIQADLIDMIMYAGYNKNYKYILTVVDIFSRYAWVQPLKSKNQKEVTSAFQKLNLKPRYLQVDQGKEFYNKEFKQYLDRNKIKLFSIYNERKASIVERFNRTIKEKLFKYLSYKNTKNWINIIQDLVDSYNNTIHSSTKMTPFEARKPKNWQIIWNMWNQKQKMIKPKLKIGDTVRISRIKKTFEKGYTPNWTEEIFKIHSIDSKSSPPMYVITDYKQNLLQGKFYEQELQKIDDPSHFPVEKIYKRVGEKYLVKFLGYPEKYWVDSFINN